MNESDTGKAGQFYVARDGKRMTDYVDTENAAWALLLRIQPMSTDWAQKYEGWSIREWKETPAPRYEVQPCETGGWYVVHIADSQNIVWYADELRDSADKMCAIFNKP